VIFASTRLRAAETAAAVAGPQAVAPDPMLIEAPLPPPPLPAFLKFNPRTWGFLTRVTWWFFNRHEDQESRAQAEVRAGEVADRLIARAETGDKVLVLAHGFFNTMVGIALKRRGWTKVEGRGHRYWTAKRFERR
jgi:broad specificity phosphatase PhoE